MKDGIKSPIAIISMIFVATMWGLSFLSTKVLLREMGPMGIAFTRFLAASLLLWGTLRYMEPGSRLERGSWGAMALTGFFGTTLYFIFENTGLKFTTASNAVLIIATIPAISIGIEGLIRKQPVSRVTLAGVIVSILGVIMVIGPDSLDMGSSKTIGNLLVLGAALSWVAFNECAGPMFRKYSKLALTTYSTWFGTALLLPLAVAEGWNRGVPSFTTDMVLNLAFLAVICSAFCYFLYMYALAKLGTTTVTSYLNIVPLVGVAGSVAFLNETLTAYQVLGGLVIIGGVTAVSMGGSKPKPEALDSVNSMTKGA